MASPFQKQALRRKLIYTGLIVALFTASGFFRARFIEAKADELALREQNLGEVEVGASALQLSLTGSRGFVVCALWTWTLEAQKKNRWNELELYVDSLTRLQPHFISPWLYQSWNLAYNVSVEADQVKDKYFYVSRGDLLLAKGERMNRYNPDLRHYVGFYQQHKIMQSDETNVFRCLYQMSCIPPPQRDPARFWTTDAAGAKTLNMADFEQFCADHPQLVRRLHDRLRCGKPEDVVRFLYENNRIPTIYVDDSDEAAAQWRNHVFPLKPMPERFPPLPPPKARREYDLRNLPGATVYDENENELSYDDDTRLNDSFNGFAGARAWYAYAQEALPLPSRKIPGASEPIVDRTRQRKSKMTVNLFRDHPPRAASYVAETLQAEGWFGNEGWVITGWFPKDRFRDGREARVGTTLENGKPAGPSLSGDAWRKAYELWERRGRKSRMLLDPQEYQEMVALARAYLTPRSIEVGDPPPAPAPEPEDKDHEGWMAARFLFEYNYSRNLSNFPHFYQRSRVEMKPETVEVRRTLFDARQAVRQGHLEGAADLFESKTGLEGLRVIMENNQEFRDDSFIQEDSYEMELRYVKLMIDKEGPITFKPLMAAGYLLGAGAPHGAAPGWAALVHVPLTEQSLMANLPVPEFVPGYSNLMQDEKEREKYQQCLAIGSLFGAAGGRQDPMPLWTWQLHLATSQDRSKLATLVPVPEFIPRALMRLEAPGKDGKPFINDAVVHLVKVRHGLLRPNPMQMPAGMQMPPGMQMPAGMQMPPGTRMPPGGAQPPGGMQPPR